MPDAAWAFLSAVCVAIIGSSGAVLIAKDRRLTTRLSEENKLLKEAEIRCNERVTQLEATVERMEKQMIELLIEQNEVRKQNPRP